MQLIRTIVFNMLFFTWTSLYMILSLWVLLTPISYANRHFKFYFRVLFKLAEIVLNLKVEVKGEKIIRQMEKEGKSFLVISKHSSAMETFFYPAFFKEYPVFVHKKELLYIPIWGWYMKKMKMISIDRSAGKLAMNKMVNKAREVVAKNRVLVIFPEGTRTLRGEYNSYKSGFYYIYKELNLPIVPIALNTGDFWNKRDFIKKSGVVTIQILPIIESGLEKKELLELVESRIETACSKL